jgi:segregation and condensation protein B
MMNMEQQIEAVLFYENEPVEIKKLCKILDTSEHDINDALIALSGSLEGRGICLINNGREVALATSKDMESIIDKLAKDEMSREIGKAGLETLAIILYNGDVSRREIDFIRGVNSTFILRNLSMRGLIEREHKEGDRSYKYRVSLPLLAHLGIRSVDELPEFDSLSKKVAEISKNLEDQDNNE